jgi:SAM-dependent methyltransferase
LGEIFERVVPETPLEWTGERLTTATAGQVEIEHLHRYFLARELCRGLDVLDVAAGEGYGTALLAQVARSVVGVEVSAEAVVHAAKAYRGPNSRFLEGDARCLPLDDASVDAVVSFETIEHFYEQDQFLAEVRRVLRPGGFFIVSSPERDIYSPSGSPANPYHVRELSRSEFSVLLHNSFAEVRLLRQRPVLGSALVSDGEGPGRTLTFERRGPRHFEASMGLPRPMYFIAVASDRPITNVPDSLYIETAEIGAVIAAAGVAEAATSELALSIRQANEQAESYRQQLLVADRAYHDHATRASALETALAEARSERALSIRQANEQAESYRQQLLVADRASHDHATRASALETALAEIRVQHAATQADAEWAHAEAAVACSQRDIARMAARRAAAASEGHWRGRIAELEQRSDEAERQATEWRHRYEGLHARLEAFLRRFWLLRASRLIPASGRRFARERLLRWERK